MMQERIIFDERMQEIIYENTMFEKKLKAIQQDNSAHEQDMAKQISIARNDVLQIQQERDDLY